ncbi:hypothetical protein DF011_14525 [Burkholderia ubonensis]|nr:hypothetical protein CJO70_05515 [Burkholderia ubonensis]PAJ89697.1 hypothetical protein CJO69_34135 [Burkholderia ubonensis]PAK09292.1 hypothetical protein CJO67_04515 [Burkholderia ubonensis]RQP75400.1 hypothetical protein DF013_14595 [Burkholderia ubonensis]RQP83753.1 hypothetical protein DF014_15455 [Burkholderia ubonensis]
MYYHHPAAQELAHIDAMVVRLEQLVQGENLDWKGTIVTQPDYWRARINGIGHLPPGLQQQVDMLLARLDAIEAANRHR